jgi:hypothetical protein
MITSPDAKLSVTGQKVWKGTDKSNGVLMMGDSVPHIEISYSEMAVGTGEGTLGALGLDYIPFGNAVWYDDGDIATKKYAKIYGSKPDTGAKFAGIMKYEQGIATGFPMTQVSGYQYGVKPWMKGTLIKRGFVWYKDCFAEATGTTKRAFADVTRSMCLFARDGSGLPVLAQPTAITDGIPVLSGCTFIGTIEEIEPENEAVLINIGFDIRINGVEASV